MSFSSNRGGGDWKSGGSRGGFKPAFGGPKKFGGNSGAWGRGDDRDDRPQMHPATCDSCHKECEVPFKPNGRKPVFCRDCFRGNEDGGSERGNDRFERPRFERSERPRFDKPAYVSTPRAGSDDVAKQLKQLNRKLDQILEILSGLDEEDLDEGEEIDDQMIDGLIDSDESAKA